ncbi:MAG: 1-acyl-sn-glycerol-3-phosphate acyltransferase [Gemmatimonadota bacterium]|nr:1-acyl-sn-glycerol-3-phosphate acyltransferase [Gemmatimonadota bacterium]MDH5284515.1 1-acyl-sn-glycerol-3-phosphate acyltransferase [Gemmatimonadota bacterium]
MIAAFRYVLSHLVMTIYCAMRIIIAAALGERFRPGGTFDEMPRLYGRTLLRVNRIPVEVTGLDRVAGSRPCVYVTNHESWLDVLALMAVLPGSFRFVAKKEILYFPFIGWALRAGGQVVIDRKRLTHAIRAYEEAVPAIHGGLSAVVFVEGTRTRDGRLLPFKKGAFVLAIAAQVPVVPVCVQGGFGMLPRGRVTPRPGSMRVHLGEPIPTAGLDYDDRDRLMMRSREAIIAMGAAP